MEVGAKELIFIERSGLLFGFIFGCFQTCLWYFYQEDWVLPIGGLVVRNRAVQVRGDVPWIAPSLCFVRGKSIRFSVMFLPPVGVSWSRGLVAVAPRLPRSSSSGVFFLLPCHRGLRLLQVACSDPGFAPFCFLFFPLRSPGGIVAPLVLLTPALSDGIVVSLPTCEALVAAARAPS